MTLTGAGIDQSASIPRNVSASGNIGNVTYTQVAAGSYKLIDSEHTAGVIFQASNILIAIDENQSQIDTPKEKSVRPDTIFSCAWAASELALAAVGLGLSVSAIIAATEGIGAPLVVTLVGAHLATLMALVDTVEACM